jgi:hypothetical protein
MGQAPKIIEKLERTRKEAQERQMSLVNGQVVVEPDPAEELRLLGEQWWPSRQPEAFQVPQQTFD